MPAFSKMLYHYLPALEKFTSKLSSRFATLRFGKSSDATNHSGHSQSDKLSHYPVARTNEEAHNQPEVELPSSEGASFQPSYELTQLQSVQTFIGKGRKKTASDDKIHLTHEISQQQTIRVWTENLSRVDK